MHTVPLPQEQTNHITKKWHLAIIIALGSQLLIEELKGL
jgi:hypothetical protein